MAVAATILATYATTGNLDTYTSANFTVAVGDLILLAQQSSGATVAPGVTGLGITWVLETSFPTAANGDRIMSLWSAQIAASTGPGAVSYTFAATTQSGQINYVSKITGADTTDGIIQVVIGTTTAASAITLTMAAFTNPHHCSVGFFGLPINEAMAPGTNFTEIADSGYATPTARAQLIWASALDTTINSTWTTATSAWGIGLEIKAGPIGGSIIQETRLYQRWGWTVGDGGAIPTPVVADYSTYNPPLHDNVEGDVLWQNVMMYHRSSGADKTIWGNRATACFDQYSVPVYPTTWTLTDYANNNGCHLFLEGYIAYNESNLGTATTRAQAKTTARTLGDLSRNIWEPEDGTGIWPGGGRGLARHLLGAIGLARIAPEDGTNKWQVYATHLADVASFGVCEGRIAGEGGGWRDDWGTWTCCNNGNGSLVMSPALPWGPCPAAYGHNRTHALFHLSLLHSALHEYLRAFPNAANAATVQNMLTSHSEFLLLNAEHPVWQMASNRIRLVVAPTTVQLHMLDAKPSWINTIAPGQIAGDPYGNPSRQETWVVVDAIARGYYYTADPAYLAKAARLLVRAQKMRWGTRPMTGCTPGDLTPSYLYRKTEQTGPADTGQCPTFLNGEYEPGGGQREFRLAGSLEYTRDVIPLLDAHPEITNPETATTGSIGPPVLTAPVPDATCTGTAPTLDWDVVTGATEYFVVADTTLSNLPTADASDACGTCVLSTSAGAATAFVTATLAAATTYWWTAKGRTVASLGKWAAPQNFNTGADVAHTKWHDLIANSTWLEPGNMPANIHYPQRVCQTCGAADWTRTDTRTSPVYRNESSVVATSDGVAWFGGAHDSHPGNDVAVLDATADPPSWTVESISPDAVNFTHPYWGTITTGTGRAALLATIGGVDEPGVVLADRPWCSHSNQDYCYDSRRNRLIFCMGAGVFFYNLGDRTWFQDATNAAWGGGKGWDGTGAAVFYDKNRDRLILLVRSGQDITNAVYLYDWDTHLFTRASLTYPSASTIPQWKGQTRIYGTTDPVRDMLYILSYKPVAVQEAPKVWECHLTDLLFREVTGPTVDTLNLNRYYGFTFDTRNNAVLFLDTPTDGDGTVSARDGKIQVATPTDGTWTWAAAGTDLPEMAKHGGWHTFQYIEAINAAVYVHAQTVYCSDIADGNCGGLTRTWFWRYDGQPPASSPCGATSTDKVPTIFTPIVEGTTAISGVAEPLAEVSVWRNGSFVAAAIALADGTWTYPFGFALVAGDTIKANEDIPGNGLGAGPFTKDIIVVELTAAPSIDRPIYDGASRTITGVAIAFAEVQIWRNSAEVARVIALASGVWSYTFTVTLVIGDTIKARQEIIGTGLGPGWYSPDVSVVATPTIPDPEVYKGYKHSAPFITRKRRRAWWWT